MHVEECSEVQLSVGGAYIASKGSPKVYIQDLVHFKTLLKVV